MPFNSRQVREYAGGSSLGGILRKGGSTSTNAVSAASSSAISGTTTSTAAYSGEAKQIDLLVFGYACKIFRDDDKAREIDQGKHLIPWMGDSSLKIDRYDVRGALYDLSPYEAPPGGYGNRLDYLSADEQRAEQLCEEERYLFLYKNEEQHILHQEEELKRFKQESSGYSQIGFEYDTVSSNGSGVQHGPNRENHSNSPTCEEPDQVFTLPTNFVVPPCIQLPETMKQHAIIEKTARFIASQGAQMEILLKAKQSNNLQFEFLTQNSLLNNYYKFVLNAIKDGTYPAEETLKDNIETQSKEYGVNNIEETIAEKPIITVPTIKYKPSANCAYTQLISKIKGVPLPTANEESSTNETMTSVAATSTSTSISSTMSAEENFTPVLLQYNGNTFVTATNEDSNSNSQDVSKSATNSPPKVEILKNSSALLLAQNYSSDTDSEAENEKATPPPEPKLTFPIPTDNLKNIIDKTATYVIKNGRQFEETLRTKSEERFTFLLPDNEYYPYYMYKITGDPDAASIEQKTRRAAAVAAALISKKKINVEKNAGPVSFSIKSKDDQPIHGLQPALPQETSDDDEDNTNKQTSNNGDNSQQQQPRTVPEHVKKAIQLVENQLMARNAQLAAVANMRSRFDIDFNGKLVPKVVNSNTNAEMERNAIFEQQQQNRHKELKRAEEKVKDKLAQIAREKLGGLITKEKQLQLERKRKAMAFLNQIKGSSENELTPDIKSANDDGDASDNSECSVHSIPITSYGPDEKTDDEAEPPSISTTAIMPKIETAQQTSTAQILKKNDIKISAAVTLSDDEDDVELIGESKLSDYVLTHKHRTHLKRRRRHSHTRTQSSETPKKYTKISSHKSATVAINDDDDDDDDEDEEMQSVKFKKSRTHKSSKAKKSSATKSHKKKSKKRTQISQSRSRSRSRSKSGSQRQSSKSHHHHRSRSHSTYRTNETAYSRSSASEESVISRSSSKRHKHRSKRSKNSHTPTEKTKSRKHHRVH